MRLKIRRRGGFATWLSWMLMTATAPAPVTAADPIKNPAIESVKAADLLGHIQVLASG